MEHKKSQEMSTIRDRQSISYRTPSPPPVKGPFSMLSPIRRTPPPSPVPIPPTTLRPQKLRRYSGESDAAAFIKEATLMLKLQPMPDPLAASWILSSLEGQARDQVLSLESEEVNTPGKIFDLLHQHWGEHRDASTLAAAFYKRQQGRDESVAEYAAALRRLWDKANRADPDTLTELTLRDTFTNGLTPQAMRRDVRRFVRERPPGTTFGETVEEAQRWMREDDDCHDPTPARSQEIPTRIESQISELLSVLKQPLVQAQATSSSFTPTSSRPPSFEPRPRSCWWCHKPGHFQRECRARQAHNRRSQDRRPASSAQSFYPPPQAQWSPQPLLSQPPPPPSQQPWHQPPRPHLSVSRPRWPAGN